MNLAGLQLTLCFLGDHESRCLNIERKEKNIITDDFPRLNNEKNMYLLNKVEILKKPENFAALFWGVYFPLRLVTNSTCSKNHQDR